ncbi:hypothetical protein CHUAL_003306 [Chamberlinius hualienensis]
MERFKEIPAEEADRNSSIEIMRNTQLLKAEKNPAVKRYLRFMKTKKTILQQPFTTSGSGRPLTPLNRMEHPALKCKDDKHLGKETTIPKMTRVARQNEKENVFDSQIIVQGFSTDIESDLFNSPFNQKEFSFNPTVRSTPLFSMKAKTDKVSAPEIKEPKLVHSNGIKVQPNEYPLCQIIQFKK